MENKNIPNETTERGRRFPLVLPQEELPLRTRPAVTKEDLETVRDTSVTRPPLDREEIMKDDGHEVFEGRITGKRHSISTTAAPVRTREPEKAEEPSKQSSPVIPPVKKKADSKKTPPADKSPHPKKPIPADKAQKRSPETKQSTPQKTADTPKKEKISSPQNTAKGLKKGKNSPRKVLLAALCILLLAAVGIAAFLISSSNKPAERPETGPSETKSIETEPTESGYAETTFTETTPLETDPAETEPAETAPPETEPAETTPPETEYVRYTVTVEEYGKEPVTKTTGTITVGEFLRVLGFKITETTRLSVSTDTLIESDMVIVLDHVEYKTEQITTAVPHTTETREVQTIPRGETKVLQQGEDGEITVSYQVEYLNGVEVSRTAAGETVTKEMIPAITEVGVGGEFVGADGKTYTYSYMRVVSAGYYRIEGSTWLGHDAGENTVAANLNYLPLGTKLYVKNEAYDFGPRTVEDTGSVDGYDILLWIPANSPMMEAFAESRTLDDVVIYYLD